LGKYRAPKYGSSDLKIKRRSILKGLLAGGASFAASKVRAVRAQTTSLKIGLLTVKTGPLAQSGSQMSQGIDTFLKEKNYTLSGLKVELLTADTGGNPATAKTKLIELVERDRADIILGPFAAFELLAVSDYVREQKIPLITSATAENITQREVNPWIVRTSSSSAQTPHAMADFSAKELKLKTMATIANDFAFGHEQCAGFQRVFEDAGGKIVTKVWPPLVTPDFVPYITQLNDVDGFFNGLGGGNPIRFLQTYASMRLQEKMTMTGGWSLLDEPLLKSLSDEAIGIYTAHWYTPSYESDSNKRFVATLAKDYGEVPGGGATAMYVAGQVIEAALQKTAGQIDDRKSLMDEIRSVSLQDTPRGPFHFDAFGNAVGPVFIRKCEQKDGKLVNAVIKTYPDVTQFWTYDVGRFLSLPVYSRDYPPARNLRS
jgi:branched-chain amino acid transport system substrate-binding protein